MLWSHKFMSPIKTQKNVTSQKNKAAKRKVFRNSKRHMKLITGIIYIFDMELQTSIFCQMI